VLSQADQLVFGEDSAPVSREELVARVAEYVERCRELPNFRSRYVLRHLVGLYAGVSGAKAWRRTLSERADEGVAGLRAAAEAVGA
jgi:tRNA-dihydrouridine synthase A